MMACSRRASSLHPLWYLAPGAVALRLLLFLGRGDYVAFDEGWYLLLGRNLWRGAGYTLSGLQHTVLSPLFPILSGALGMIVDNPVWAGRIVAAVAGGLLVVPCWFLFRRLGGRQPAVIGCVLVAVMPSLAPFVAPYWIGWDLWVGAEPLLHLFLYSGLALGVRALHSHRVADWTLAGVAFALAYLARPEAIIATGVFGLGIAALAVTQRRARHAAGGVILAVGFALAAAPYSIYLHAVMGRWAISGRQMAVSPALTAIVAKPDAPKPTRLVEDMLWRDESTYVRDLYALDPSGTRLANGYWGVAAAPPPKAAAAPSIALSDRAAIKSAPAAPVDVERSTARDVNSAVLYARALGTVVPLFLLPLILIGVLPARGRNISSEAVVVLALLATSGLIVAVVGADPRTQLFLAPLAAFYTARGIRRAGTWAERRAGRRRLRRGMLRFALTAAVAVLLLGTAARWLYFSVQLGSPHHLVGAENRRIAESLQSVIPPDAPLMSWHPALALYARRDWRVLPQAELQDVVRYANATGSEYIVLSPYYPAPIAVAGRPRDHVLLRVPPGSAGARQWDLQFADDTRPYLTLTPRLRN